MAFGLRARLLLPSALITVALLGSVSYFAMRRTESALHGEDDLRLREMVTQIAIAAEFGVEWKRREDLPPRLDEIVQTPSVCWLAVHAADGTPLLMAHREGKPRPEDLESRWYGRFPTAVEVIQGRDLGLDESVLEYRAPVFRTAMRADTPRIGIDGPFEEPSTEAVSDDVARHATEALPIGLIRVGMSQERNRQAARRMALEIGSVALVIGLLSMFLLWMSARSIARPILRLVEDTSILADGNLRHRTQVFGTHEIATLARAFNRMAQRIAAYHEQVIEQNQNLERKVEERTLELTRALEELKRLDRLKDEFLSNVSHEFRTPLTSIRSYGEILRDYADEDPALRGEFLAIIVAESERLTRLIEETLDLSKIRSGTVLWRNADIDVHVSLREVLAHLEPVAARQGVRLELVTGEDPLHVLADQDRLIQIWTNLVGNAIKFSPAGSAVRVIARCEDDEVLVDVVDEGPGIPLEDHERIFEQFGQSGDVMTDKPMGTGLGLTIASEIATHYGGSITVESRPGQGATFTAHLKASHVLATR